MICLIQICQQFPPINIKRKCYTVCRNMVKNKLETFCKFQNEGKERKEYKKKEKEENKKWIKEKRKEHEKGKKKRRE